MKAVTHSRVLTEALLEVQGLLETHAGTETWARQARRVVREALSETHGQDPLMAAAIALGRSVQVLEGELTEASTALKAGRIWVCVETPERIQQARAAIQAARAAGAEL